MKLLTVVVPCYNSAEYLNRCVETLLPGSEDMEILIVDDGSTDATADIAQAFADRYPATVKVIRQPNKGHGGAIMTGLGSASGAFFKVVDSDDRLDGKALAAVLDTLRALNEGRRECDLMVCNYVYDKVGAHHKKHIQYTASLPQNRLCGWEDTKRMPVGHYMLMHALIYRTQMLRESGLSLPEHCYYVDNLYAFTPMRHVRTLYYMNIDLYLYFIGRENQSVHEDVMIRHIDQQLAVNRLMIERARLDAVEPPALRDYLTRYLEIITAVSSVLLIRSGTADNLKKKDALWAFLREKDPSLYRLLSRRAMGRVLRLPGKGGRAVALFLYRVCRVIFGFN